jgi:myo-inositol 2-dehydrogenase/D-chiro-inositol 1-dehydrogenase
MTASRPSNDRQGKSLSRREFGTGVAAVSIGLMGAQARGQTASNAKVKLGLIGCGGRGTWIAKLFQAHGGYEIVAGADYFADRVNRFGDALQVPAERRYTGLSGYKKMLDEAGVEAVAVESPPYFHPQQAADAVDAGKHVYVAKPIAVDVPGCKTIGESGKKATDKGLCFQIDFQTRADQYYMEALKRVHEGAIGEFAFGESTYHAGIPWTGQIQAAAAEEQNPENRLRAWGLDRVLSGDIITEQNIHTLDVANWIMNGPPESAYGTGGQKVRDFGTCWDTFSVVFHYPNNVGVTFSSRQFNGHGTQPDGIRNRMFGSDGVLETAYGGDVLIRGKNFYRGGRSPGIYKDGAVTNIATFHDSIQKGDCSNPTVVESVRSNLLTVLGRTAAYEGRIVTWKEILDSNEPLVADLKGLKA